MREVIVTVAKGALVGLVWGVVARLWMRFISTSPEFSWEGSGYIVAAPTIVGGLAGLVLVARRRRWRRTWLARVAGGGSMILFGVGAGIMMVPTLLFGTLAVARTDWPRWSRTALVLLALVPVTGVLAETWILFDSVVASVAALGYLLLVGSMILILQISLAPQARPALASSSPPGS